jgi:hypothetical protein
MFLKYASDFLIFLETPFSSIYYKTGWTFLSIGESSGFHGGEYEVFWDVASFSLVKVYRRFRWTWLPHIQIQSRFPLAKLGACDGSLPTFGGCHESQPASRRDHGRQTGGRASGHHLTSVAVDTAVDSVALTEKTDHKDIYCWGCHTQTACIAYRLCRLLRRNDCAHGDASNIKLRDSMFFVNVYCQRQHYSEMFWVCWTLHVRGKKQSSPATRHGGALGRGM